MITFPKGGRCSGRSHLTCGLRMWPRWGMKDSGRHRGIGSALVRALFAMGLLIVASLQPGMVAMAKSAMHSAQSQTVQDIEPHDHDAAHASHEASPANDVNHHGDASSDLCCDMHCMPSASAPPTSPELAHPACGAFGPIVSGALTPGEAQEFIRPPRI